MRKKISSRDLGPEAELNRLKQTKQEYLDNAERYKDPNYIPYGAQTHEGADPEGKIKYWTDLAKAYDRFILSEENKIKERLNRPAGDKANFNHVK